MPRKDKKRAPAEPESSPAPQSKRLTPIDVQQKEFRVASRPFRGYDEQEVDEFLDRVTEELARLHAEHRRLQEETEFRRTVPVDSDAAVEADEVVRKAREEAARILAEAEARTGRLLAEMRADSPPLSSQSAEAVNRFLAREREFLQSLAGLIQRHAESVKGDARALRQSPGRTPPQERAEAPGDDGFERESDPVVESEPGSEPDSSPNVDESEEEDDVSSEALSSDADPVVVVPEEAGTSGTNDSDDDATDAPAGEFGTDSSDPDPGTAGPRGIRKGRRDEERAEVARAADPPTALTATVMSAGESPDEDRTLRELFWGED